MIDPITIMIYAESGVGKSAQVYELTRYLLAKWKKEGSNKTARLINTDGGGSMTYFRESGLEKAGLVEGIDISASNIIPLECKVIADGRWPSNGYKGGETEWYDIDLEYIESNIGVYIFEGFDSMANRWKGHMSKKKEGGVGFKHSWKYEEETTKLGSYYVGGLDKGHYGIVQSELDVWWNTIARRLPVEYIICTSLVSQTKDNRTTGPSSVGNAQAGQIPQWFGYTFHLEKRKLLDANGNEVDTRIAWYESHVEEVSDIVSTEYLANVRTLPEEIEERNTLFPGGFIQLIPGKRGIKDYFKWRDEKHK